MPGTVAGNLAGGWATSPRRPATGRRRRRTDHGRSGPDVARPAHRTGPGQRDDRRPADPPGPGPSPHPERARPLTSERLKATRAAGGDIPGMANIAKLSMSAVMRLTRDLGLRIVGGPGHAARLRRRGTRPTLDEATGNPFLPGVTGSALYAQAPSIYGGHRPDPAQHHRRAGARPAQGARERQGRALLPTPEERLSRGRAYGGTAVPPRARHGCGGARRMGLSVATGAPAARRSGRGRKNIVHPSEGVGGPSWTPGPGRPRCGPACRRPGRWRTPPPPKRALFRASHHTAAATTRNTRLRKVV